jgi:hypothetical protein
MYWAIISQTHLVTLLLLLLLRPKWVFSILCASTQLSVVDANDARAKELSRI